MPAPLQRYAALLRGVSPMNLKMQDLKECLESAGFKDVKTVLSSGNAVFGARASSEASLERKIEKALEERLGRSFRTFVRSIDSLRAMLDADPYRAFKDPSAAKRVVTFLPEAPTKTPALPVEVDGACIYCVKEREAFTAYVPGPQGPVFMTLLEKTFGRDITTRTWDTVKKIVKAGEEAGGRSGR